MSWNGDTYILVTINKCRVTYHFNWEGPACLLLTWNICSVLALENDDKQISG